MILNEFIKETDKNQMIKELLKHYGVGSVKMKYKSMKDFAHYDVDRGELQLSKRYKTIKDSQIKEFLITMIHEIRHAMDAKKYGWKKVIRGSVEEAISIIKNKDKNDTE